MLNLNSFMLGTKQPKVLAEFYEKVLGKPADMTDPEHGYWMWQVGTVYFTVGEHSKMVGKTKEPGRMMCNFETSQVKEEFERIKALGAVVIKEPYELQGGWIATFADPDGNYFQLMSPFEFDGLIAALFQHPFLPPGKNQKRGKTLVCGMPAASPPISWHEMGECPLAPNVARHRGDFSICC